MAYICSYDSSTSRHPLLAVDQNRAPFGDGLVDETARGREVNKEIRVVSVFDRNPQLLDPASRNVSWDRIRTDGDDMGDPPLRYGSRGASGDQAIREADGACQISRTVPMEREIRHELSKQKLIFNDRVDVLPTHRLPCVEKGISGRNVQECEEWRIPG